jgi:hypothetical protein
MSTSLILLPWLALSCSALLIGKALSHLPVNPAARLRHSFAALAGLAFLAPSLGNAILMYVCGSLVAVGIVTAGVAMMSGRQSIAKWAFAGALVAGLAFPIVKTMWSNIGLTPPDVSTYTP